MFKIKNKSLIVIRLPELKLNIYLKVDVQNLLPHLRQTECYMQPFFWVHLRRSDNVS